MHLIYSFRPRTTAERAQCGDFVRALLAENVLPKALAARVKDEIFPVLAPFTEARLANLRTGSLASQSGSAFRTSSATLRAAIEGWMRSLDELHDDTGWAEVHLRVHFDNKSLSRLFARAAHAPIATLHDALAVVAVEPPLQGAPEKLAKVRSDYDACAAALVSYDTAIGRRKGTVEVLQVAAVAFDREYENFAARLVQEDVLGRRVPQFIRGRKVADPEFVVQPDPDVETPADADAAAPADTTDATDAAPAPDAVAPDAPETPDPIPE